MHDPRFDREPLTPSELWSGVLFLLLIIGLFAADVVVDFEPAKLSVLLFAVFWVPLLVLHEVGHAVVAALLGWHVGRVVIGMGRPLSRFRVGATPVEIRFFPLEGFVVPVPTNMHLARLKSALIYFAGVGSEILLLGLATVLVGPDVMLTRSNHVGVIALQTMGLVVLVSAFINLVPHTAQSQNGPVANDGLGMIWSFLVPESQFAERIGLRYDEANDDWRTTDRSQAGEQST
jgi:hypothetical protein